MPSRIKNCFAALANIERCALVTYVTAGDPTAGATAKIMQSLVRAGADIIELGVPFSDPMADGPTIQRASDRALSNGMNLNGVLEIVRQFRRVNSTTPIVLMGYLNPIDAMGYERFSEQASDAGVDGVLVVDVPPEEAADINATFVANDLDQIFLIAPNSSDDRIDGVCEFASGFVYYVSVKGVTGSKSIDAAEVSARIQHFRKRTTLPIGVGFGIKSAAAAAAVANAGDAIIVGSAIIELIERHIDDLSATCREVESFVAELHQAIGHPTGA